MRATATLLAGLLLTGCAGGSTTGAASCAPPQLTVSPSAAAPGQPVTVTTTYLRSGCNDHGENGVMADEERALTDVPVVLVQGDVATEVATVDAAGPSFAGTVEVTVPVDTAPGPATIVLDGDGGSAVALEITG